MSAEDLRSGITRRQLIKYGAIGLGSAAIALAGGEVVLGRRRDFEDFADTFPGKIFITSKDGAYTLNPKTEAKSLPVTRTPTNYTYVDMYTQDDNDLFVNPQRNIVAISSDNTLQFYTAADVELKRIDKPLPSPADFPQFKWNDLALSPDGKYIAGTDFGGVSLYDTETRTSRTLARQKNNNPDDYSRKKYSNFLFSPDGKKSLYTIGEDSVMLYDFEKDSTTDLNFLYQRGMDLNKAISYSWTPDSNEVILQAADNVEIRNIATNAKLKFHQERWYPSIGSYAFAEPAPVDLSPDGSKLAYAESNSLHIYDLKGNHLLQKKIMWDATYEFHDIRQVLTGVQWSPNGQHILFKNYIDGKLQVFDIARDCIQTMYDSSNVTAAWIT